MSVQADGFISDQIRKRQGVTAELIDIADLHLPVDDAGEPARDTRFSEAMARG
jgi:hypothetical protein